MLYALSCPQKLSATRLTRREYFYLVICLLEVSFPSLCIPSQGLIANDTDMTAEGNGDDHLLEAYFFPTQHHKLYIYLNFEHF